jgi:hypothetical protein
MHYLKLTIQKNRRRIRIEQLLLLLLRTVLILLLFFLLARPVMHAAGLSGWLGGRSATSQILLVDDSLSMQLKDRGKSAFDRALELADSIVRDVQQRDRFTLAVTSRPANPILREVETSERDPLLQAVKELEPSESYTSWEPTLTAVEDLINGATYPIRELTIITDMRRAGWDKPLTELSNRWLASRVRVRLMDVGLPQSKNVALESLQQVDRIALAGVPSQWQAIVRNDSENEIDNLDADFIIDGRPTLVRLPVLPAGKSVQVPLSATFAEPGPHHVAFKLAADDLPGDDQRWGVVHVKETLHMMLVDGEPSSEPLGGEADFLGLALSLGMGEGDAFQIEVLTDAEWASRQDAKPDLLVLANVPNLNATQVDAITKQVEAGMGLMIFPGDQVDPDNYNQLLYKGGTGLIPAELEAAGDEELSGLVMEQLQGSPIEAMQQLNPSVLERIRVKKYYQLKAIPADAENVRVLARWNNPTGAPAALQKIVGQGQVIFWTTTADKAWTDWPTEPSYVLAMREAARAIARSEGGNRVLTAGEALRRTVPPLHAVSDASVETPGAKEPRALHLESPPKTPTNQSPTTTMVLDDTRRAGLYTLTWKDSQTGATSDLFAVNPDARESKLDRLPAEELRNLWGSLQPEIVSAVSGGDSPIAIRGQEIWRTLASVLLGLVAFEACFATWAGRQR